MSIETIFIVSFVLLISVLGTYIIKLFATRFSLVDIPNHRSSHSEITPRGGGLAIVIAWYIGISLLFIYGKIDSPLYFAFIMGALLALVSFIDDIICLSPIVRLGAQVISSLGAIYFLNGMEPVSLYFFQLKSQFLVLPIILIGMVWFINLYNFLDGIDGYASVEAIFLGFAFYIFTQNTLLVVFILAVLGFLFWNWPKAKIFMGDVGSTQLGFILAVFAIYFHNTGTLNIGLWLILTSPFWFDASYTLFRRWRNREQLSHAHKKHAYQRIVQGGYSHKKALLGLIGVNLTILLLTWFSIRLFDYQFLLWGGVLLLLFFINRRIDRVLPFS
jgi:Fuc2NAc and GlcNAc transferase